MKKGDNYAASYANKIQHDLYPNEDAATIKWAKDGYSFLLVKNRV